MKILISILLAVSSSAFADPGPEAEKFLDVSNAQWKYDIQKIEEFDKSSLDKEFATILEEYHWNLDDSSPSCFIGFKLDLNKDGKMEYFIIHPHWGGSGGPYFFILSNLKNKWREIGQFQGWFYLLPEKNDWLQVLVQSRAGGGNYSKTLLEFSESKYRGKWIERFEFGNITKKILN